jgi:hypothetical protein
MVASNFAVAGDLVAEVKRYVTRAVCLCRED